MSQSLHSRRGSVASTVGHDHADKEMAQVLDQIHSSAAHSATLTTFNAFASPPPPSSQVETKGIAGELMQNGFSGLYHRFKGVMGGSKEKGAASVKDDNDSFETNSAKSQHVGTPTSRASLSGLTRESSTLTASPVFVSSTSSRIQSPTATSFVVVEPQAQGPRSSTRSSFASTTVPTIAAPTRPNPGMVKASSSSTVIPTVAAVHASAFRDDSPAAASGRQGDAGLQFRNITTENRRRGRGEVDDGEFSTYSDDVQRMRSSSGVRERRTDRASIASVDGSGDGHLLPTSSKNGSLSLPQGDKPRTSDQASLDLKRPPLDRITQSHLPGYQPSRASSTDRSTAGASPVTTSAHNSVRHDAFSDEGQSAVSARTGRSRIPGTTTNEGNPEAVSAKLEQMKKQVLSKEFWMADDNCKECFLCNDPFTAFRRKHHCRTCGCIFDSKCTSIISGERFGVQGSLRVCKTCLAIMHRRYDSSDSDDSEDDQFLASSLYLSYRAKEAAKQAHEARSVTPETLEADPSRQLATPMMAIPATRRIGDNPNRRSAILEIDAPQLSRPSSARSLKSLTGLRPTSSGHRRHHSKNTFLGRFKSTVEDRAPFHRSATEDGKKKLPAFHDDNIIDPDLAPYMSDEESSGDEQMSIFSALNNDTLNSAIESDRAGFGSLLTAGKKHRSRVGGEKSVSGLSLTTRGRDEPNINSSHLGHIGRSRRRNMSNPTNMLHSRPSPRQSKTSMLKGLPSVQDEGLNSLLTPSEAGSPIHGSARVTRSLSMRDAKAPAVELNNASVHHVKRLLTQLLQDADIPNASAWEKALIPILLQCTDDVNPDVRNGDDIDIRHYVKVKKIPGGKPSETSYVSGVVFSKNLALKSMPRSISHPRIVIVSFPIEYQRQQQFMSLQPVIAMEKDFLRNLINRIASLQPELLLVQKHISGLALQYLAEANIAVAYNVKPSVIEAVSRCAQTEVISSIDMVTLKHVHVGRSQGFDVKTYVHKEIPGKKKTCIYISGCPKDLGCTIVLRGASTAVLRKVKRITEFMVYVVYNLKLETCLMRDEYVMIPSVPDGQGNLSPEMLPNRVKATNSGDDVFIDSDKLNAVVESSKKLQELQGAEPPEAAQEPELLPAAAVSEDADATPKVEETEPIPPQTKLISAHQSHVHEEPVPEDVPMPTFYSDMVAKHQTKILSASPFVKFSPPYLLMRSREQERRLEYLRRLRDQDAFEESTDPEKAKPQKFELIRPEMVHGTIKGAPRQIMEVLHAVHDAEYDKALHIYQTQTRQWENYLQGNINLFDPYEHQNIMVLYTLVCTATTVPCSGPDLVALGFYDEHENLRNIDPDCTLGQYVEDLCLGANSICHVNGCDRTMFEHHRTYVHGEARITVFVEKYPCKLKGLEDSILMWSYCKKCEKETQAMPMSESTWKYSFGKYLELSFWCTELHLRDGICPHDIHRDHLRYFGFRNVAMRIHWDPIDLLEIVVPRTRITWKVEHDLRLKNDLFTKTEERWTRFMISVKARIEGINPDGVGSDKMEACKAEKEKLAKRAQDEHAALIRKLQDKYMSSKYYEVIPLNRAVRAMQEKVVEWDAAFADFDRNFFPSEKDIRRLAAIQLKKIFIDDESHVSLSSADGMEPVSEAEEKSPSASIELSTNPAVSETTAVTEDQSDIQHHPTAPDEQPPATEKSVSTPVLETTVDETPASENVDIPTGGTAAYEDATEDAGATPTIEEPRSLPTSEPIKIDRPGTPKAPSHEFDDEHSQTPKASQIANLIEGSTVARTTERGPSRRKGSAVSPPMNRAKSQPTGTLRRSQASKVFSRDSRQNSVKEIPFNNEIQRVSTGDSTKSADKKFSERFGLKSLNRKAGQSLIPRSVRKDSQVTSLAKHFEQLSREFEKERMRDRKQRAAKTTQSRGFPKASARPIVEVYKDVNEAVAERVPDDSQSSQQSSTHLDPSEAELAKQTSEAAEHHDHATETTDASMTAEETATEAETDDNMPTASQAGSDDEGITSDVDPLIYTGIPNVKDMPESFGVGTPSQLELPRHEKTSLMKMLSNFWAERSASGWTPLDYPLNFQDHVFGDSDVIVREDEPSSLIAFALNSQDYRSQLQSMLPPPLSPDTQSVSPHLRPHDLCEDGINQQQLETTLLQGTGTHMKFQFVEGSAKMLCKIFYAEQFDALRQKCGVSDRIVESLSRCLKWDSKGGKTKSVFLKTLDDRLILKSLSPIETSAFLRFAPAYFNIMAENLFHDLPSAIAKMLGFYQVVIKNPVTNTDIKLDLLLMENLFYDRSPARIFDLKGSMRNRKIQSTGQQNEVLLDENMVEFIYESPLFAREHAKKLLRAAVWNDTLFLARQNVMDYSLMIAVDEARQELVVGIIDCIRTYTWDKKLESWIKDRGFAGGGRNRPTVTSPKEYKSRFREAMARYVLQAPNCWNQFPQMAALMPAPQVDRPAMLKAQARVPTPHSATTSLVELHTDVDAAAA